MGLAFAAGAFAQSQGFFEFALENSEDVLRLFVQHVQLVAISSAIAVSVGVPLGILLTRGFMRRFREAILNVLGICQTVPSLAVIAIAMSYLGIGRPTAIFALVVYSLLPIVRNTVAGILDVDPVLLDAGQGMGMTPSQVLFRVELPNALYIILTGIRTSTVINVGTAAMSFLVGGGGLGDLIFTGLAMVDPGIMLAGAVPTAFLAIAMNWAFGRVERLVISKGLIKG
ncbi:MAG: ABC transporter permease [Deltaproteobacteria bacterium]|nr:ABC transporter permease [Deltaproteobacteria bacterium]